ncbi:MAG: sugar phosphate isomerase/epimerase family protein, partial [bacterium]
RRMRDLADIALNRGLTLLMETWQETAADMRKFLVDMDHPALGINFDPANMILYGKGNPVKAVKTLGPWIRHVHIKDAKKSKKRGEWGAEVPWGKGEVDGKAFLRGLRAAGFKGAFAIEREAGSNRMGDIKSALKILGKS